MEACTTNPETPRHQQPIRRRRVTQRMVIKRAAAPSSNTTPGPYKRAVEMATITVGSGFTVTTGGAVGADTLAMQLAVEWGMTTKLCLPPHHPLVSEKYPAIASKPLALAGPFVARACQRLGRHPSKNPFVRDLLARNWFIAERCKVLYAYANFEDDSLTSVEGGSGVTVQMCVDHNRDYPHLWKNVFVFDESRDRWYELERDESYDSDESDYEGTISETLGTFAFRECFCGPILHPISSVVGSRNLGELGRKTMKDQFKRTVKEHQRWVRKRDESSAELRDDMEKLREGLQLMSLKEKVGVFREPIGDEDSNKNDV